MGGQRLALPTALTLVRRRHLRRPQGRHRDAAGRPLRLAEPAGPDSAAHLEAGPTQECLGEAPEAEGGRGASNRFK